MPKLFLNPHNDAPYFLWIDKNSIIARASSSLRERAEALDEAFGMLSQDIDISAIDEVLMVSGPGNFTALRTGLGYVRGLSLAYNVPSRSLSIFELDFALLKRTDRPFPEAIVRDAKAGRYYQAKISRDGELGEIALVQNIGDVVSFEDLQGIKRLEASPEQIDQALCLLAQTPSGETPAMANYIRPANADLPHDPPLQILPDHG